MLPAYFRVISNGMAEMIAIAGESRVAYQGYQGCARFF